MRWSEGTNCQIVRLCAANQVSAKAFPMSEELFDLAASIGFTTPGLPDLQVVLFDKILTILISIVNTINLQPALQGTGKGKKLSTKWKAYTVTWTGNFNFIAAGVEVPEDFPDDGFRPPTSDRDLLDRATDDMVVSPTICYCLLSCLIFGLAARCYLFARALRYRIPARA